MLFLGRKIAISRKGIVSSGIETTPKLVPLEGSGSSRLPRPDNKDADSHGTLSLAIMSS